MPITLAQANQLLSSWLGAAAGLGQREGMPPEAKEMSAALWGLFPAQEALLQLARRHEAEWDALLLEQGKERWVPEYEPLSGEQRVRLLQAMDPLAANILVKALAFARIWLDQEGVNAEVLDALAAAACAWAGRNVDENGGLNAQYGPDAMRCNFCGKYGDESTLDPVSGDGWGCVDCVDHYQRGGSLHEPEQIQKREERDGSE
jgi:hypothetical protein